MRGTSCPASPSISRACSVAASRRFNAWKPLSPWWRSARSSGCWLMWSIWNSCTLKANAEQRQSRRLRYETLKRTLIEFQHDWNELLTAARRAQKIDDDGARIYDARNRRARPVAAGGAWPLSPCGVGAALIEFGFFKPWELALFLLVGIAFVAVGLPSHGTSAPKNSKVHGAAAPAAEQEALAAARGKTKPSPPARSTILRLSAAHGGR